MYVITIEGGDLGQIIDGLRCRSEAYHKTEEYLVNDWHNNDDSFIMEEVKDEHEAAKIALYYDEIIAKLEGQMKHQDILAAKTTSDHLANAGGG